MNEVRQRALRDIEENMERISAFTCKGWERLDHVLNSIDGFSNRVRKTRTLIATYKRLGLITDNEAREQLNRLKATVQTRIG